MKAIRGEAFKKECVIDSIKNIRDQRSKEWRIGPDIHPGKDS